MDGRRIFAVGDIHGCYGKLTKMLGRLDWAPGRGDLLVFLGDYIDRGPQSYEVVETLLELKQRAPGEVVTLTGNHERLLLKHLAGSTEEYLYRNGLQATLDSYRRAVERIADAPAHVDFFKALPLSHETEKYIFVHAGLRPGRSLAEQDPEDLVWIREPFLNSDYDFGRTVVFGHTPMDRPRVASGRLGLDTGAVYGGPLTAAILPAGELVMVE